MNIKTIPVVLIVILITLGIFVVSRQKASAPVVVVSGETQNAVQGSTNLRVYTPKALGNVGFGEVMVTGEARLWYFEGSFPVMVYDSSNTLVGAAPATAQGEWMTTEFVPFKGKIIIDPKAKEGEGYILFSQDNPAGEDERSRPIETFKLPIYIPKQDTMIVSVYFGTHETIQNDCSQVFPLKRVVPKSESIARVVILELLKGVNEDETGYLSQIPKTATLKSIDIKNGIAKVDLAGIVGGGACSVGMIRSQIEMTLKQFKTVEKVEVFINGKSDILEP